MIFVIEMLVWLHQGYVKILMIIVIVIALLRKRKCSMLISHCCKNMFFKHHKHGDQRRPCDHGKSGG